MNRWGSFVCAVSLTIVTLSTGCDDPQPAPPAELSLAAIEDRREAGHALLQGALTDEAASRRARAALALGRIQDVEGAPQLLALLQDHDIAVRRSAIFALGQFGLLPDQPVDPSWAQALAEELTDATEPLVVADLVEALGKLAGDDAQRQVVPFLTHASALVREQAAYALFRCRFVPLWRQQVEEPPAFQRRSVDALVAAFNDPEPSVRVAAVYAFSRYKDSRAGSALVDALTDQHPNVRLFALRGLGQIADPTRAPHLIARLRDESAAVRTEAVTALGAIGRSDAAQRLMADPSVHVRCAVASAFGASTTAESIARIKEMLNDGSVSVRVAAIDAMSTRLGPAILDRIELWALDEDWRVRVAAARAAGRAGASAQELGETLFRDADRRVAVAYLEGISGGKSADELVLEAIKEDDLAVRGAAVALVVERDHLDQLALLQRAFDASPGNDWIELRETIAEAMNELRGDGMPMARPRPTLEPSQWVDVVTAPTVVEIETERGVIAVELYAEDAPIHVASFLSRVDAGFYDGLIWHRVVSNFVIQGGDPRGDGWGSDGETVRDEINRRRYGRGAVGMPKAGKDTGGCQIFITHLPTPHLDGNYTVFGQVLEGFDVVDAIEAGDAILSIRRRG
jgi:cyclophilin family peptidyl-prolyl cis-trans isomerase/HEAT repeat protein